MRVFILFRLVVRTTALSSYLPGKVGSISIIIGIHKSFGAGRPVHIIRQFRKGQCFQMRVSVAQTCQIFQPEDATDPRFDPGSLHPSFLKFYDALSI